MRIALTIDPYIPVPPRGYGGIERVVDLLVRRYVAGGHDVTLVAHPGSTTPATHLIPYGCPPHVSRRARVTELAQVGKTLLRGARSWDVLHSFGRLAAMVPVLPLRSLPKVQTYQRDGVPWRSVRIASALGGASLLLTGCSTSVYARAGAPVPAGVWETVFNCVDVGLYTFVPEVPCDAPLVFLGRLEPFKGVHHAIAIARGAGRRLLIAGNRVEEGFARGYFDTKIRPHLDDVHVSWVGEVDDAQKNALLGTAAALLMPIEWDEPFGIVMIEAMACGTPVIAFRRGSVPEVIVDGQNGYSVEDTKGAIDAVGRLSALDRAVTRAQCEARFSAAVIASRYESLYLRLMGGDSIL